MLDFSHTTKAPPCTCKPPFRSCAFSRWRRRAISIWISSGSPGTGSIGSRRGFRSAKKYAYMRPGVEEMPWGRVMAVIDPFGNRLSFCESQD